MDNEGGEDMEARHLREKNELQEKVAELKKSIQKADKEEERSQCRNTQTGGRPK